MKNKWSLLFVIIINLPYFGYSQEESINQPKFEVNRIYPYIHISKEELKTASAIVDLNKHFKSSWVRNYISVEILTTNNGELNKTTNKNNLLSQQQKYMMNNSDIGTSISVQISYIPDNTMKYNEKKEFNFNFTIDPENEASYSGGEQQLIKYLKEKAIDKIPINTFINYDLTAVKFTINTKGEITNAHIFGSEYNSNIKDEINMLLLETISNMPCWHPAEHLNGLKVEQEFVLTVGNMKNCMINLLNI